MSYYNQIRKKIIERDELIKKLYGFGIETRPGFYSSDQLEIYENIVSQNVEK